MLLMKHNNFETIKNLFGIVYALKIISNKNQISIFKNHLKEVFQTSLIMLNVLGLEPR